MKPCYNIGNCAWKTCIKEDYCKSKILKNIYFVFDKSDKDIETLVNDIECNNNGLLLDKDWNNLKLLLGVGNIWKFAYARTPDDVTHNYIKMMKNKGVE